MGISNYEGSFGAVSVESGTLSISGNAYMDSLSFAGGSVEFSEGAMLFVSGDFGAADGAGAKTELTRYLALLHGQGEDEIAFEAKLAAEAGA